MKYMHMKYIAYALMLTSCLFWGIMIHPYIFCTPLTLDIDHD